MRAVVLADTHVRDGGKTRLPDQAWEQIHRADVILHAGDITGQDFLDELRSVAPVHVVLGNNDRDLSDALPFTLELELGGVTVGVIHDTGPANGRERRMFRRFPTAGVVVFGHSHIPWNAEGLEGQLLFNPGSPTQPRRQPHPTLGILHLESGTVRAELITVAGDIK